MDQSILQRIQQFDSFYRRENKRKLLGFFCGSEYPLFRYPSLHLPEGRALRAEDFSVDAFLQDCESLYSGREECGGDAVFCGSAFWGIPWLEALMGSEIYADYQTGSLYAKKPKRANLEFDENNEWAILCERMLKGLQKLSAGRFPLATTRMRGISDLLANLYGEEEFILH